MDRQPTVVCFGDSLTEGIIGASYVDLLRERLPHVRIVNAGANGDTTLNLLRRVERDVLAHQPDVVLLLVGLNDYATACGRLSSRVYYWLSKRVYVRLTPRRFARTYRRLLSVLRERSDAHLVLCTLTTLGEHPNDPLTEGVDAYSHVVRALALQEGLPLVDLRAAFQAAVAADPRRTRPYRIWLPAQDALAIRLRGASYASIARQRGARLLVDGAHLADAGAALAAETILPVLQQALAERAVSSS